MKVSGEKWKVVSGSKWLKVENENRKKKSKSK